MLYLKAVPRVRQRIIAMLMSLPLPVVAMVMSLATARAQDAASPNWPEMKCARYTKAWTAALTRRGPQGLSPIFLDEHKAFIVSGCIMGKVCPRSPEELTLSNDMVVLAMNAGMASTFLPFSCRKVQDMKMSRLMHYA